MGRGRLRRGFSLEVIFEEDTDLCSYLDSLDSVRILAEEKEVDQLSVDSLLEDKDLFKDNFFPACPSCACPHFHATDNQYSSFDFSLDMTDMDTCLVQWDDFPVTDLHAKSQWADANHNHVHEINNGRRSRVSRREILESNRFLDPNSLDPDDLDTSSDPQQVKAPSPLLQHSILLDTTITETNTDLANDPIRATLKPSPPADLRDLRIGTVQEVTLDHSDDASNDTCDNSDLTDTHTYAIADAHDDVNSIASSTQEFSDSSGSGGSVTGKASGDPRVATGMHELAKKEGDVRRVREMFERTSCRSWRTSAGCGKFLARHGVGGKASWEDDSIPPVLPPRNPNSRSSSIQSIPSAVGSGWKWNGGNGNKSPPLGAVGGSRTLAGAGGVRGSLNQLSGVSQVTTKQSQSSLELNKVALDYDLQDLLVNDNVVIEESPDIFQTHRSQRIRGERSAGREERDLSSGHTFFSSLRTLRRTKSMGTGIFQPEYEDQDKGQPPTSASNNSPSCILAEEMPAPNIVKNVRNVFERLSSSVSPAASTTSSRILMVSSKTTSLGPLTSVHTNNNKGHGNKQSLTFLTSIKSNPTSKILRSESFHQQPASPDISPAPPTPTPTQPTTDENTKREQQQEEHEESQPTKMDKEEAESYPSTSSSSSSPSDQDQLSLVSSLGEEEEPKYIPPHVLSRIRSCGTTTTYFGGQIVAKTIENRTLRVNASPLRFSPPPTPTPQQLHHLPLLSPPLAFNTKPPSPTHSDTRTKKGDRIPRIVSVVTKCGSKGNSPNGSLTEESCAEGRNSPEGCESEHVALLDWHSRDDEDANNNHVSTQRRKSPATNEPEPSKDDDDIKFSEISEGAWF